MNAIIADFKLFIMANSLFPVAASFIIFEHSKSP